MDQQAAAASFEILKLAQIRESALNPRHSTWKLDELVASVKAQGVLVPLTVRPVTEKGAAVYELVDGARRFRAAAKAKLADVPAVVREMTDDQALEAMIVAALNRENLHPLEEADGIRALVTGDPKRGIRPRTPPEIAAKLGKPESYVHQRMRLCALSPEARRAFERDQIGTAVALYVARIPVAKLQDEAVREIMKRGAHAEDAKALIQSSYMLRLDQATFSIADAQLDAKAGACTACPKRTGNQRELFADVKSPDVCTDPLCFARKRDRQWTLTVKAAEAKGQRVLSDAQAARLFVAVSGVLRPDAGYVDLTQKHMADAKGRTWRKLLGKDADEHVALARDPVGHGHELVKAEQAMKLLRAGPFAEEMRQAKRTKPLPAEASDDGREKRRRAEDKLRRAVVVAAMAELVEKIETQSAAEAAADDGLWSTLVDGLVEGSWSETVREALHRRGWLEPKRGPEEVMRERAAKLSGGALRALAVELVVARKAAFPTEDGDYGATFATACRKYDVSLAKIAARLKAEAKAAAKGKPAKGGKPEPEAPADDAGASGDAAEPDGEPSEQD